MEEKKTKNIRLIGIISDTHDNIYLIDEAVKKLNAIGVDLILHAGDYVSPFTIRHFKPLKAKLIGVFGNNCAEWNLLANRLKEIGGDPRGFFAEIPVDGLKIALLHGHDGELLQSVIATGAYDVVVYGHTHEVKVERIGRTLVINPGEVCGYLSGRRTMAILNSQSLEVEIMEIPVQNQV